MPGGIDLFRRLHSWGPRWRFVLLTYGVSRAIARTVLNWADLRPRSDGVIISLTTHPRRAIYAVNTLLLLLGQRRPQDLICLTLFSGDVSKLRKPLKFLRLLGLAFLESDSDYGPYLRLTEVSKKYPSSVIVTYDDDTLYTRKNLEELLEGHQKEGAAILGHRGSRLAFRGGSLSPYADWTDIEDSDMTTERVFLTCSAGNLYPPSARRGLLVDWEKALLYSQRNDDLWYFFCAIYEDIQMFAVKSSERNPIDWQGSQEVALWRENVEMGKNDRTVEVLKEYFNCHDSELQCSTGNLN